VTSDAKTGAERLREFLKDRGIPLREAAKGIRVSHPAIVQWLDGTAKPSAPHREALDRWTNGAVPAESWLEPHEATRLDEITPWKSTPDSEAAVAPAPPFQADVGTKAGGADAA